MFLLKKRRDTKADAYLRQAARQGEFHTFLLWLERDVDAGTAPDQSWSKVVAELIDQGLSTTALTDTVRHNKEGLFCLLLERQEYFSIVEKHLDAFLLAAARFSPAILHELCKRYQVWSDEQFIPIEHVQIAVRHRQWLSLEYLLLHCISREMEINFLENILRPQVEANNIELVGLLLAFAEQFNEKYQLPLYEPKQLDQLFRHAYHTGKSEIAELLLHSFAMNGKAASSLELAKPTPKKSALEKLAEVDLELRKHLQTTFAEPLQISDVKEAQALCGFVKKNCARLPTDDLCRFIFALMDRKDCAPMADVLANHWMKSKLTPASEIKSEDKASDTNFSRIEMPIPEDDPEFYKAALKDHLEKTFDQCDMPLDFAEDPCIHSMLSKMQARLLPESSSAIICAS